MVCALPSWSTNSRLCAICNASPETVDNLFHVERADIKVRLQEIPSGWLYRIRLKIEQNCRLFWDILSSAVMNDLFMTFTIQAQGGCQMCLLAAKLDDSGELLWITPSWLSAWVSVFWARRMDLKKGVPTLFAYCEKLIWKFFFKFKQGTCPWMAFAWNFFRIFLIFSRGVCGAKSFISLAWMTRTKATSESTNLVFRFLPNKNTPKICCLGFFLQIELRLLCLANF